MENLLPDVSPSPDPDKDMQKKRADAVKVHRRRSIFSRGLVPTLRRSGANVKEQSGGKAYVSTGPVSHTCSYTESGKTVTPNCDGDKTVFTVDDDGSLNGPQGGFLGRLNKKK